MSNKSQHDKIMEKLVSLRQAYAQKMSDKINEIDTAHERLLQGNWDQQEAAALHGLLHKLAGAAGTFGFQEIGQAARNAETVLKDYVDGISEPDGEQRTQIAEHLEGIKDSYKQCSIDTHELNFEMPAQHSVHAKPDDDDNRLIFLLEDDVSLADEMVTYLSYYGYHVRHFARIESFKYALQKHEPIALISDIMLPDGNAAEVLEEIQKDRTTPLPVIFITVVEDMLMRLQAVRSGGIAYFRKPVDPTKVVDTLDSLLHHKDSEPNRVLIVEDSSSLSDFYSFVLKQAGMETIVVNDPMLVMQPLEEFRPDLILMDLYMPGCSGIDLAKIIRQQEAFHSIPIVYLSVETNTEIQMEAMRPGGDEFLTKPIKPGHLVSSVNSRVRRARILRSFMVRDSLTGLFNHTLTKEYLYREVEQARRRNGVLSFAMIDIDYFKSVNDSYGHTVGDQVIRIIAKLINQRMRSTDIIGRYGGEEFAVIMPDTRADDAKHILDELRHNFSQIPHHYGDIEFTVTISCGVAEFPACSTAAMLNEIADEALYAAKNRGRNQVVKAEKENAFLHNGNF